jgi:hypothetical protein
MWVGVPERASERPGVEVGAEEVWARCGAEA